MTNPSKSKQQYIYPFRNMVQYSTALSHIFLALAGLYCFKALNTYKLPFLFSKVSFGFIAFHSLLGIWKWGNPIFGYKIDAIYRATAKLQDLFVLPSIVTTIWLKHYSRNLAYAHTLVCMVPLLLLYFSRTKKPKPLDAFLGGNLLSLVVVSFLNGNHYGVSTAISYWLSYFIIKGDVLNNLSMEFPMPTMDLFNYSMCFFAFFALKAVLEPVY